MLLAVASLGLAACEGRNSLPVDIARGLSTDARVLDCRDGVVDGVSAFAPDWVEARRVDLDGDGLDDWLVEGRHRCLMEGDVPAWWAYAGEASGYRLVLAGEVARQVDLPPVVAPRTLALHDGEGHVRHLVDVDGHYVEAPAPAAVD